jgi:hypothetical protein
MVIRPDARRTLFLLMLSCACRHPGEPAKDSDSGATDAAVDVADAGASDSGSRYEPRCLKIPSRKNGEPPHVERDGNLFRLCDTQLEMEAPSVVDVPICNSCNISDMCRSSWNFRVCTALVKVRIDTDWAKLVGSEFSESDLENVKYAELFGRSAQRTTNGIRHRLVDLMFLHGHGWRAHIEYSAAASCADEIDEMIASAHVPTTFPDDQTVPLPHGD